MKCWLIVVVECSGWMDVEDQVVSLVGLIGCPFVFCLNLWVLRRGLSC